MRRRLLEVLLWTSDEEREGGRKRRHKRIGGPRGEREREIIAASGGGQPRCWPVDWPSRGELSAGRKKSILPSSQVGESSWRLLPPFIHFLHSLDSSGSGLSLDILFASSLGPNRRLNPPNITSNDPHVPYSFGHQLE